MADITIEKIREDDTKLEIRIWLNDRGEFHIVDIGLKPKGKRKFTYVCGTSMTDDYSYRTLNMEERREYKKKLILNECSEEILKEALEEAWRKIKPISVNIW